MVQISDWLDNNQLAEKDEFEAKLMELEPMATQLQGAKDPHASCKFVDFLTLAGMHHDDDEAARQHAAWVCLVLTKWHSWAKSQTKPRRQRNSKRVASTPT